MNRERKLPRCFPVEAWSAEDQAAWTRAQQQGDIFDGIGLASGWRAPTRRLVEQAVGRFLGWLVDEKAGKLVPVPDAATPDTLRAYANWLDGRVSPVTVHAHVRDLVEYCRVAWPDVDRTLLHRAERSLSWRAVPTKDKRPRIVSVEDLVRLGEKLMADAQGVEDGDHRMPLTQYRDGLAIAFLALRPLRIRAFASLQLSENLICIDDAWKIVVSPDLSKTKRHWEADFPTHLVPALEHYLDQVRPQLMKLSGRWYSYPGRALWISNDGSALKPKALGEAITRRTTKAFGWPISPHLFRDCAASTLAHDSPANVRLATPLLGHSNPRMAERHYNQARQIDAGRKHIDALARLRRNVRG
jgi:integrase